MALLLLAATALAAARADAVQVRVHGAARIEGRVEARGGELVVSGTLRDDAGAPVSAARVAVALLALGASSPLALPMPRPCAQGAPGHEPRWGPDEYVVDTDDAGAFCVRASLALPAGTLRLAWGGSPMLDAATRTVAFDAGRPALTLAFVEGPRVFAWEGGAVALTVRATDVAHAPAADVAVSLAVGASSPPLVERTDARGEASFTLRARDLGAPGARRVHAAFAGDASRAPAEADAEVVGRASVTLVATRDAVEGRAGDLAVTVRANAAGAEVASGTVEARIDGVGAGAAEVERGVARVPISWPAGGRDEVDVTLVYLPRDAGYAGAEGAHVRVRRLGPSLVAPTAFALGALGVAGWLARGALRDAWRRLRRRRTASAPLPDAPTVDRRDAPGRGFAGEVLDAHDGARLGAVSVSIVVPAFTGDGVVARAFTDALGRFALDGQWPRGPARLRFEASGHDTLELDLPRPGALTVRLVARRRRLLERLVSWAHQAGVAPRATREPTPADVARQAPEAAAWARAVEQAAFGPDEVDAARAGSVDRLAPP